MATASLSARPQAESAAGPEGAAPDRFSLLRSPMGMVVSAVFVLAFVAPSASGGISKVVGEKLSLQLTTFANAASIGSVGLALLLAPFAILVFWHRMGQTPAIVTAVISLQVTVVTIGAITGISDGVPLNYVAGNAQYLAGYVIALGTGVALSGHQPQALLTVVRWAMTLPAMWTFVAFGLVGFSRNANNARLVQDGAAFALVACMLWIANWLSHRSRWSIAFAVLCALTPFISGTRGNQLALAVSIAIFVTFLFRGYLRMGLLFVVAVIATFAPTLIDAILAAQSRITGRGAEALSRSQGYRASMSIDLMDAWQTAPWFGHGFGYVPSIFGRRAVDEIARPYIVELSYHNMLVRVGIIGVLMFALAIALQIFQGARAVATTGVEADRLRGIALVTSIVGLLIEASTNPLLESVYFHLFLGLCLTVWFPYIATRVGPRIRSAAPLASDRITT